MRLKRMAPWLIGILVALPGAIDSTKNLIWPNKQFIATPMDNVKPKAPILHEARVVRLSPALSLRLLPFFVLAQSMALVAAGIIISRLLIQKDKARPLAISPLQGEAFMLAREMLAYIESFEPMPPLVGPHGPEDAKLENRMKRQRWRERFSGGFSLRFGDRLKKLELQFAEAGISLNRESLMSGGSDAEKRVRMQAAALVAMACRLDGMDLEPNRL